VIAMVIVFPASLFAGYQFPLMFAMKGAGAGGVADDVGQIYASNMLGSIAGSLAGGFGLLPLLSAQGAWVLSGFMLIAIAVLFGVRGLRTQRVLGAATAGLILLSALALRSPGPTAAWRHTPIGAGRSNLSRTTWNAQREALLSPGRQILA